MPKKRTSRRTKPTTAAPEHEFESIERSLAASGEAVKALRARLSGKARTVLYVHGIGNKPAASVLKCQWDRALFGFDLGARSRLAYWVSRVRYPEPSKGGCGSDDFVDGDDHDARRVAAQGVEFGDDVLNDALGVDFDDPTLRGIAAKMLASEEAFSGARFGALQVGGKILLLPAPWRRRITRRLTKSFLEDVHDLFYVQERRDMMLASVRERLRAGGGPFVVVGHSQGSMIAYLALKELERELVGESTVELFLTIGSPLGIQECQDQLKRLSGQKKLRVPSCVGAWLNVADLLDVVAADKRLDGDIARYGDVAIVDDLEWNKDSPRHPHSGTGYLAIPRVRAAVREAVDTALFQPVAGFTIARDVARELEDGERETRHSVLIELAEVGVEGSLAETRDKIVAALEGLAHEGGNDLDELAIDPLTRFIAARLTRHETEVLAARIGGSTLRRIWKNAKKRALVDVSANTVQALPAQIAYRATGEGITWAVLDSGVNEAHPHFAAGTVAQRYDCTRRGKVVDGQAPDEDGHGTHVAGIIAGTYSIASSKRGGEARTLAGMAPRAKLVVYKVLDDNAEGDDAWIIKALDHVADSNERAGRLVVHGVNLSLGGAFDQSSYACGHSPLCRELARLWRQGVLVVIAAGNEGFALLESSSGPLPANMGLSVGDPANLEDAIVVGSVHKENPHTYGISYFSSRGPTADGRQKPDLVAPGERILSCRHDLRRGARSAEDLYVAMSGTSMAAPHVSGVLAAFLSRRQEFIGQPDRVKRILLASCTDLGRVREQQGAGLVNLVKMLVST